VLKNKIVNTAAKRTPASIFSNFIIPPDVFYTVRGPLRESKIHQLFLHGLPLLLTTDRNSIQQNGAGPGIADCCIPDSQATSREERRIPGGS
jgi:hypothetical protein